MKVLLMLLVAVSSVAVCGEKNILFTKDELQVIYKNHFMSLDLAGVKKVDETYFVLSSVYAIGFNHERRLEMKAKQLLLRHFYPNAKKPASMKIKAFFKGATWRKQNRIYLLSYIKSRDLFGQ